MSKIHYGTNCMDCLEGLKLIKDNSIDLIVTSPPYNLGKKHHTRGKVFKAYSEYNDDMPEELYQQWQTEILNECFRVLKDDGSIWYNHKNRIKDGIQISPYEWINNSKFKGLIKQEIIWHNGSPNFDKIRFYPQTERIYWMAKSPKTKMFNAISHNDIFSMSEWKAMGTKGEFKRAFPEQMVRDIISCFDNSNIVMDIFSGSVTKHKVTLESNRKFIGFELSKEYIDIEEKRIKDNNLWCYDENYNIIKE